MKTSFIKTMAIGSGMAALAAFTVLPVMAEGAYPEPVMQFIPSTLTRAEVRAEYARAVADGSLRNPSESSDVLEFTSPGFPASTLTRAEVHADAIEWLRLHRNDVDMGSR